MKILITGPQGSGKTTQAKILGEKLGFCLIKIGDMIRDLMNGDNEEAREIRQELLDEGGLIDDRITARLMKERLGREECQKGYVVDGYPRRLSQLELFDPGFDKVFFLKAADEIVIKRMEDRGRVDDTQELIEKRLRVYHQETEPVISYYQKLGKLIEINGEGDIEQVSKEIAEKLNAD